MKRLLLFVLRAASASDSAVSKRGGRPVLAAGAAAMILLLLLAALVALQAYLSYLASARSCYNYSSFYFCNNHHQHQRQEQHCEEVRHDPKCHMLGRSEDRIVSSLLRLSSSSSLPLSGRAMDKPFGVSNKSGTSNSFDFYYYEPHVFPRWGDRAAPARGRAGGEGEGGGDQHGDNNNKGDGIDFSTLLDFALGLGKGRATTIPNPKPETLPEILHFWGHLPLSNGRMPSGRAKNSVIGAGEGGVWVASELRNRTTEARMRNRVLPVEMMLERAWTHLARRGADHPGDAEAQQRWPRLLRTMTNESGFPFILWHGDNQGCNFRNYREGNASIPLLTTCARVNCSHAIPFPAYQTIKDSLPTSQEWKERIGRESQAHAWTSKVRKLVWRGSMSGPLLNYTSSRGRIGAFAAEHRGHPLLDVGISNLPLRWYGTRGNRSALPPDFGKRVFIKPKMPMESFENYRAVLDTDGNSWSSRFGKLLCMSSVVVKVEPQYVDYFYKTLHPWIHYVPVRYDLSDLLEKAEWVLDPVNHDAVLKIIDAANAWCHTHMTHQSIILDMLDVFEAYVSFLDRGSADWPELWRSNAWRLWDPSSGLGMRRLAAVSEGTIQ